MDSILVSSLVHIYTYLFVSTFPILCSDKLDELVVNVGTFGKEECAARRQFMEKKELLLNADSAMISFLRLFDSIQVFLEELLFGIANTVDSLFPTSKSKSTELVHVYF